MELYQVKYFLALCETLNFTRAAEKCAVSQPSLTRAIQNLEGEFGGPLFHRERQRTHLTELGRLMQPYFEQVYEQAQAAKDAAKTFAKLDEVPLKIGVMCTIGPGILGGFFGSFRSRYPGIEVQLLDAPGYALAEMLLAGTIEVAIYGLPEGIEDRYHALPLFNERFVIACSNTHRFAAMDVIRCRDLHQERYVNRYNCEYYEYAGNILRSMGIFVNVVMRSERDDWVQAMILAGLGFGFFSEFSVTMPGIVIKPLIEPEFGREINLVTVRGRPHSPAVGAFVRSARSFKWPGAPGASSSPTVGQQGHEATGIRPPDVDQPAA
ncbi:MAG: LysR family transcriptional regulator [Rhodospirillales bacterium]|nr:LysR family transcriptional regulator [Rhodospirillales bacterium]